jgi:hypothetical protein
MQVIAMRGDRLGFGGIVTPGSFPVADAGERILPRPATRPPIDRHVLPLIVFYANN